MFFTKFTGVVNAKDASGISKLMFSSCDSYPLELILYFKVPDLPDNFHFIIPSILLAF